jgi:hypothetical protein
MAKLNARFEPNPDGSDFEKSHPFVVEGASGQKFRLNRAEASLLWCDLEIALNRADDAELQP